MKGRPIEYFQDELEWLRDNATMPRKQMHQMFVARFQRPDVSQSNLKSICKRNGWMTGRTGQFNKGDAPLNKGKKMPYHPNSAATRFQKGQRPHTYRGPGHEMVDSKDGYVWLIVAERNPHTGADTRRVQKHKWLWEKANGPVPKGHVLKCLDGDKTNCDPSNWEAIPQSMLPRLNGRWTGLKYDQAPPELKPTVMALAKLDYAARTARKGAK